MEDHERLAADVVRLGGTARYADLMRAGHSRLRIQAAVRSGAVQLVRRGLAGVADGAPEIRTALKVNGLITCISAAKELRLWTIKDAECLHLWSDHGGLPKSVATHRSALVGDRLPGAYVPVVDAVLHALRCRPPLEALVLAESAVRRGAVSQAELVRHLPGPRNGARRAVVHRIGKDADSPLEVIARELFRAAGLRVETQVEIRGLGRVDLLIEGRLIVELDGMDFHWTRDAFRKDRRRNNEGVLSGLPTLRYVYEDVVFRPQAVLAQVVSVLRRGA
ncbi:endonuclease domain-containing protein [Arthrobacter sp. USHLN218]|uniref:endonuclease domain-containing protein n=1 Tax=Arthrobacter sp. USHLN218 TaxID=3081232 RepID=UPI0030196AC8